MIILCSWCPKHTHYSNSVDHKWNPITRTILRAVEDNPEAVSHGICGPCANKATRNIERDIRRSKFLKKPKQSPTTGEVA